MKRISRAVSTTVIAMLLLSTNLASSYAVDSALSCDQGGVCHLNDTGPGGGKIIYVSGTPFPCGPTGSGLCNVLEWGNADDLGAARTRLFQQQISVSHQSDAVGANARNGAIGEGYKNTMAWVEQNGVYNSTTNNYAAGKVRALTIGGKSDWYLPNAAELAVLYSYVSTYLPGFLNLWYMDSSSEVDAERYIGWWFGSGNANGAGPNAKVSGANNGLAAIRAFTWDAAAAVQTRAVVGGTLYDLRCNGSHDLQLGTVNVTTGEFTNVGDSNLSSTTGINTCINAFAFDPTGTTGMGYVLSYSTNGLKIRVHSLNFTTGAMSSGSQVIVDDRDGSGNCLIGFTSDGTSYYVLFTKYYADTYEGIFVAKINPVTRAVTESHLVANGSSLLSNSSAACYVLSGFAFNPVDTKLYIATGNSDGGNRTNGYYHLWSLDPTTGGLVDVAVLSTMDSETSEGITPHSFFTMTFDSVGTIWGLANSRPKGFVATQSATVSGWSAPGNLSLSTARVKAAIDGEDDNLVFMPSVPYVAISPAISSSQAAASAQAAAKAAAEAAAAKREAEKQAARADITSKLKSAKDLTVDAFAKAEIPGITASNIAAVQAELLALPESTRTDINQVLKIAHKYEVVGNIGSDQINYMQSNSFIEIGLIPADSKNKVALVAAVRSLPEGSRDTYAEIKTAIDAEMARIQARKDRLVAAITRNSNRYTK